MVSVITHRRPTPMPPAAPLRLIPLAEVCARTGYSRWWIRASINAGTFPKPVPTAGRTARFVEHEIDSWIAGRIAARDAGAR